MVVQQFADDEIIQVHILALLGLEVPFHMMDGGEEARFVAEPSLAYLPAYP